jgi:hypothetical protein
MVYEFSTFIFIHAGPWKPYSYECERIYRRRVEGLANIDLW